MDKRIYLQRKKDYSSQPYFIEVKKREERMKRFVESLEEVFADIDNTEDQQSES